MAFDFMKDFMVFEDDDRFSKLCEMMEDVIREADCDEDKLSDLEAMQALDFVGYSLFRDDWEEFKRMEFNRDIGNSTEQGKKYIN